MQAEYKLRELNYYSNRTIRRVENVIQYNMAQRKITYLSVSNGYSAFGLLVYPLQSDQVLNFPL